jgi:hypothetical protein
MSKINEDEINKSDVKAIFRAAVHLRNKPNGFGRIFQRLSKTNIDLKDLQDSWKEDGFSDDTDDIKRILSEFGFGKKEINKVFSKVLGNKEDGDKEEYTTPVANSTIQKIADFCRKNGLDKELIAYMQEEYGFTESIKFPNKTMIEDVRQIFISIVHEERSDRINQLKAYENTHLGRNKK